ncbi:hypothetical protein B0H16DRAFT_211358 [Mycena metata]|uniref:Uncharacterized protein n=1 Tax=Mycena metata TaxID=1033252 RepID=A0AAD7HXR9_9AGAR|nr:hypothetical protein B0H16DRAFT_211358 [Mycena metata]
MNKRIRTAFEDQVFEELKTLTISTLATKQGLELPPLPAESIRTWIAQVGWPRLDEAAKAYYLEQGRGRLRTGIILTVQKHVGPMAGWESHLLADVVVDDEVLHEFQRLTRTAPLELLGLNAAEMLILHFYVATTQRNFDTVNNWVYDNLLDDLDVIVRRVNENQVARNPKNIPRPAPFGQIEARWDREDREKEMV